MPSHQSESPAPPSRERLLAAAKRLIAAQGYEQTATSAIAREAGTSESQLMRYFGGKVGLLEALFDQAWVSLDVRLARATRASADHVDAIIESVLALASALGRDPDLAVLFLFEGRRLRGAKPHVRMARGFQAFATLLRGLVRDAQAAGEIHRDLETGAVTAALLGAAEAMIRERLHSRTTGGRGFPEKEIRRTLEALLEGLASPPRHTRDRGRAAATRGSGR